VKSAKNPATDRLRNRLLALALVVLGLAMGFGTLYWMGGLALIRDGFNAESHQSHQAGTSYEIGANHIDSTGRRWQISAMEGVWF